MKITILKSYLPDLSPCRVQVDLLEVRRVTGVVTQGGEVVTVREMVTEFTLLYGLTEDGLIPYTEGADSTPKVVRFYSDSFII